MPASTPRNPFADLLRAHAVPLTHLDPAAPLDDLEPLRDIIGDARVVALGENSHFITEFSLLRRRILRFLAERCGFTVLAFEYGFSEGFPLDAWAQGQGTDDDLDARLTAAIPVGVAEPLRWIRRHNATAEVPVRFAGIDVPAAGGSLLPALTPVADYLRRIDPETLPLVQQAIRIAESFAGASAASAAPAWTRLAAAEQDALSAILMRLLIRFRAVEVLYVSRGDRRSYEIALCRIEAACHADYGFRAMAGLYAGTGLTADTSARDVYMAGSVLWHLERFGPGTRIVLAAHNAHIQKTPVSFDGHLTGLPMGQHLHRCLADEYVALALTSITGHTADMRPDEDARFGFAIDNTKLEPPEQGSIEAAFADAGLGLSMADLRRARAEASGGAGPDRIRIQSAYLHTPVLDAFDGIVNTPVSTVAGDIEN
ncbi:erythromycin esterase family protein [Microbispora sp. SCL1-1]|uniref:erythromycin esterase family protein n=1 Tax=unclassified Microbispora TaxID=2614687 RepID=UPI00115AFA69|nr:MULTISPECIES: erythromycin esterase family protein [unclassified Microbispora]NJP24685.1 erythromycin esterase family protein [Microbispora sp. CL1-1]TQS14805.1 erythromycin esterase family protein [Microbispora sp. SCL1-1]